MMQCTTQRLTYMCAKSFIAACHHTGVGGGLRVCTVCVCVRWESVLWCDADVCLQALTQRASCYFGFPTQNMCCSASGVQGFNNAWCGLAGDQRGQIGNDSEGHKSSVHKVSITIYVCTFKLMSHNESVCANSLMGSTTAASKGHFK